MTEISRSAQIAKRASEVVTPQDFGAKGDYVTDDTAAIDLALASGKPVFLPEGVYRYTGTLSLPEGVILKGEGTPRIATFPQSTGNKSKLRPNFKTQLKGSVIIFDGTGTINTINMSNRSDKFSSMTPAVSYDHATEMTISDIAFIQDMDVLDSGGSLTTGSSDNRATGYSVGFYTRATKSLLSNVNVFGYFSDQGTVISNANPSSENNDYNSFSECILSSGVAIVGNDSSDGIGLTGQRFTGCGIYGTDHHTRADGLYAVNVLYIDGNLASATSLGIRGHTFTSCNFRGYANNAISLDHCDDLIFNGCVFELSNLSGVTNADADGKIVGTGNTKDVRIIAPANTGDSLNVMAIDDLANTIAGSVIALGSPEDASLLLSNNGTAIKLRNDANTNDPIIQLTNNTTSNTSDWQIRMDSSSSDDLKFIYDNVTVFKVDNSGIITPTSGYKSSDGTAGFTGSASASATLTIKNGLIVAVS